MEYSKSYLERLVNSKSVHERWKALKAGYGLERFVHDHDYTTRAEVANQGYGLDLLSNDTNPTVQKSVHAFLEQHNLTLEDWIQANPDKCIYPFMRKQMRDAGLQVSEITLLTADEVEQYASIIPKWKEDFWIQPGSSSVYGDFHAFTAGPRLDLRPSSIPAERGYSEMRPALRMKNCHGSKFNAGDKLSLLGNTWTVLASSQNEVLLLADKSFGVSSFGKTGPYYEMSKIKKHLDGWLTWKLGNEERKPSLADRVAAAEQKVGTEQPEPKHQTIER